MEECKMTMDHQTQQHKVLILPKLIYRFNTGQIKTLAGACTCACKMTS